MVIVIAKLYIKQECISVGCVPPTRYCVCVGGLPDREPPGQKPPSCTETPLLDRDPWIETPHPSWTETPYPSWTETPHPSWTETSLDRDPPCEQNHRQMLKHYLAPISFQVVTSMHSSWMRTTDFSGCH